MPGTGYYDRTTKTYKSLPTETWADYTNWSTFTSWAGTPSDTVSFTTGIFDAGKIDWHNTLVDIEASLPADVTIYAGETLESAGQIDIASTTTITPSTSPVAATYGRYFQFTITLNKDSALQNDPEITSINVNFNSNSVTLTQSDIDTSTLAGSVGARQLTFNQPVGKLTNVIVQPHYTGLDDSAGESQSPVIYIDKSATPTVLNIFNIDTYGKRTRMDCVVDVQAQARPRLVSDEFGSIEEA